VSRAKYTKPPGPLPAIEQIQRSQFRFRDNQWHELTKLLPSKLANLGVVTPDAAVTLPEKVKTIADCVIQRTEDAINSHLTASPVISEASITPARVRAAIRRLREALKPFLGGRVDIETADIVPADLDAKLAAREHELERRLPAASQRMLTLLCQTIRITVTNFASANRAPICDQHVLKYIDLALTYARIKHPDLAKHRDRLAALVFEKGSQ
jgi:hypothetical protein